MIRETCAAERRACRHVCAAAAALRRSASSVTGGVPSTTRSKAGRVADLLERDAGLIDFTRIALRCRARSRTRRAATPPASGPPGGSPMRSRESPPSMWPGPHRKSTRGTNALRSCRVRRRRRTAWPDPHSALMPTVPGPRTFGLRLIADHDRVDVAEAVDLQRRQDGEIEEVDLPVDEVDHVRQVHPGLRRLDVLEVGGRQQMVARRVDHAAGAGDPPQRGACMLARQIAGGELDVGVGADDDLLAIGDVARQQHRQRLAEGRICSHVVLRPIG